jgi:uncharacterized membrane protein
MKSCITNQEIKNGEAVHAREIREGIYKLIKEDYPGFDQDCSITLDELNNYRRLYLSRLIEQERGELDVIDKDVMNAMTSNSILTENIEDEIDENFSIGQRLADHIATFGGSWTFIITFFSFILAWMLVNIYLISKHPFDPYPFILLNLILSCIASIQAPIIMMSQNRQEQKDRVRAEHDYKINLKAELEIKLLSEKIDHMIVSQNKKLLEIQQIQTDYLEDLMKELKQVNDKSDK